MKAKIIECDCCNEWFQFCDIRKMKVKELSGEFSGNWRISKSATRSQSFSGKSLSRVSNTGGLSYSTGRKYYRYVNKSLCLDCFAESEKGLWATLFGKKHSRLAQPVDLGSHIAARVVPRCPDRTRKTIDASISEQSGADQLEVPKRKVGLLAKLFGKKTSRAEPNPSTYAAIPTEVSLTPIIGASESTKNMYLQEDRVDKIAKAAFGKRKMHPPFACSTAAQNSETRSLALERFLKNVAENSETGSHTLEQFLQNPVGKKVEKSIGKALMRSLSFRSGGRTQH